MAKKATSTDPNATPKKPRKARKPNYYLAQVEGSDDPVVIVAKNHKNALSAVVSIRDATASDLILAGKQSYRVIDTTVVTSFNVNITDISAAA
jgi:hypothetical protein